ncbi:RIIa domain-containing protein 1 [Alligator mississippiensis]|uniref:RIIa domain-containing protein 1 n=1 Tax=Alligator mississippiensis TaxID=8496 RepID=A0A151M5A8_ALLMI|nr:RIIa domain-containing protein 1 [Alligator mississippiensis]KYO19703.1 RIIa domain-containing protein 1 [Alligator mississippiensis]
MADVGSGLEGPDLGALSPEQQARLLELKISTRIANERYLRDHREVELLLSGFVREVLLRRPENIPEFAAEHFTDPELPMKIQKQLMEKVNATERPRVR